MKINGQKVSSPNIELIVIPRGDDDQIVLRAQAVRSYEEFDKLCPYPKPPKRLVAGTTEWQENVLDPDFIKKQNEWARRRSSWMILESLKATEGLEWETVKADDPTTWNNVTAELEEAGFSDAEMVRITQGVMAANGLSEDKIRAARERFLASRRQASEQS